MISLKNFLPNCKIEGNTLKLPEVTLDRKDYLEVKKALELIGGKWKGGKVSAFVFPSDPTGLIDRIVNGEKLNTKKEFQAFYTPKEVADKLVRLIDPQPGEIVLEPSAGNVALIDSSLEYKPKAIVFYC